MYTIDPPMDIDLLALQNGLSETLGVLEIPGGFQINQIRLGVDKVTVTGDGTEKEAVIVSETGLKIVNAFDVPLSGTISITVDFDVRKSIVENSGNYTVKPVLRAVLDGEAGRINGTAPAGTVVYAYSDGTYSEAEATVPDADGLFFTNAYTSTAAESDGTYVQAYLDAGVKTWSPWMPREPCSGRLRTL